MKSFIPGFVKTVILSILTLMFIVALANFTFIILDGKKFNILSFTAVGFLMLIAISNLIFSRSRSVSPDRPKLIEYLNSLALCALSAAIAFLLASFFGFIRSELNYIMVSSPIDGNLQSTLLTIGVSLFGVIAFLLTYFTLLSLIAKLIDEFFLSGKSVLTKPM